MKHIQLAGRRGGKIQGYCLVDDICHLHKEGSLAC